jgi:Uma2 family endonuclease
MPLTKDASTALLEQTDGRSELYDGELREKPPMSVGHNEAVWSLLQQLIPQLSRDDFEVRTNAGHLAIYGGNSYIPDVMILPKQVIAGLGDRRSFERYDDPMPFVVEVSSPSTGTYDIDRKISGYIARGDLEIWRIHPFDRVVTIWRRQEDGSYVESALHGGTIHLHALPDVTIDLDALWA